MHDIVCYCTQQCHTFYCCKSRGCSSCRLLIRLFGFTQKMCHEQPNRYQNTLHFGVLRTGPAGERWLSGRSRLSFTLGPESADKQSMTLASCCYEYLRGLLHSLQMVADFCPRVEVVRNYSYTPTSIASVPFSLWLVYDIITRCCHATCSACYQCRSGLITCLTAMEEILAVAEV